MMYVDDDLPRPPSDAPSEGQNWACGPFGLEPTAFLWPLTFPWGDGVSWGQFTPAVLSSQRRGG